MAKVLNFEAEIANGLTIKPEHIKQSVDAFTGADDYDITISGSLVTTGSIKGTTTLTIGSGHTNTGTRSSIAGGTSNTVEDQNDSILSGQLNKITNSILVDGAIGHSAIIGGCNNKIDGTRGYNFIAGGYDNIISGSVNGENNYANIILGRSSIIDACDRNSISGGGNNIITGSLSNSNIAGGVSNCITGQTSTIGGGAGNCVLTSCSVIAGGVLNSISGACSTIGGGCLNTITCTFSTIGGGFQNCNKGESSTISGGRNNTVSGIGNAIVGGCCNVINATSIQSVIGGGCCNNITGTCNIIGGGNNNTVCSTQSFIGGGNNNRIFGSFTCASVITGGESNIMNCVCQANFIGGGYNNKICANVSCATIIGGRNNTITDNFSNIIGSDLTSDKPCYTFMNNVHITGSTTANGILQLSRRNTTPTGVEGMIIASGSAGASKLYYYNGSTWNALF